MTSTSPASSVLGSSRTVGTCGPVLGKGPGKLTICLIYGGGTLIGLLLSQLLAVTIRKPYMALLYEVFDSMAKIGNSEYPEMSFTDAMSGVESVWREKITTVDAFAKRLGHASAKSGAFYVKMAALNKFYGLLDQTKTEIGLSERAKRILMGTSEDEKAAATIESILAVPIFRDLYAKLGYDYHKADFLPRLRDLTAAPVEQIHETSGYIQKLYDDATRYLKQKGAVAEPKTTTTSYRGPIVGGQVQASPGMLVLQIPGKPAISVPWDPVFIESVIEFLKKEKQRVETSSEAETETRNDQIGAESA
jgi:hypothetical protein